MFNLKRINGRQLWRGFVRSNYITALWNWFLGLAGKAAEPVLFASVLYSGYELVPGVPQPTPSINAVAFVIQQAALDVGGMGLIKLTKDEDPEKFKFARGIGVALIVLMVINMIFATAGRVFAVPVQWMQITEGILLIIRSVMAVLFGHAIHTLKDESIDVMEPDIEAIVNQAIESESEQLKAAFEEQIEDLKQRLKEMQNSIIFAQAPAIIEPGSVAPNTVDTEQNEPAQNVSAPTQSAEHNPVDTDLLQVLENYPKVANEWLAKNKKTVTLDEIMQVTGQSKRRINRAPFQRSGRNKDLILVSSVIDWLKTVPLPTNRAEQNAADSGELPASQAEQNTDPLPVTNGHRKVTRPLEDLVELDV